MKYLTSLIAVFALVACQPTEETPTESATPEIQAESVPENSLATILAAQPDEIRARYQYRHPQETIEFFGIEPGMTILEGLPGGGWYTRILAPYIGSEGHIIGVNYSLEMFPLFSFATEEFMERQRNWISDFPVGVAEWGGDNAPAVSGFYFGSMPADVAGTADVVFFPRVIHNLARFESEGDFFTTALGEAYAALKPGGILGIVQHEARDDMSDSFADGSHGYLRKSFVIAAIEQAGFEFVAESDINQNPADQPGEDDIVWRLQPSYATSRDNPELQAELEPIGESNRMTLRFRKPE